MEPEGWWCWLPLTTPPTNQKTAHKLTTPSLNHSCKTPHYPLQVWTQRFWGQEPAEALFAWQSSKIILFCFTQNSASEIWFSVKEQKLNSAAISVVFWHTGFNSECVHRKEKTLQVGGRWLEPHLFLQNHWLLYLFSRLVNLPLTLITRA